VRQPISLAAAGWRRGLPYDLHFITVLADIRYLQPGVAAVYVCGYSIGGKTRNESQAPVGELHLSVAPADKNTAPDSARQS
jgi:hypothetical protein